MSKIKTESKIRKKTLRFAGAAVCMLLCAAAVLCSCGKRRISIDDRRAAVLHADRTLAALSSVEVRGSGDELRIDAPQAFVYNADTEKIIFERGKEKILYPASTTKLLTALCALEVLSPEELITPGNELEMVNEHSSIAFIKTHHTLTCEMLIEGMLLPSGNDAAYALAAAAGNRLSECEMSGAEAVSVFVSEMNRYAKEIGMCGSNFTSPDGYFDEEHYSTVEDMAILASSAAENDIIMKYARLASDNVTYASGHTNTWKNTNLLLDPESKYYCPEVTGLKTGSLENNYCMICTFESRGVRYIAGVFTEIDGETRFADMKKIVEYYR